MSSSIMITTLLLTIPPSAAQDSRPGERIAAGFLLRSLTIGNETFQYALWVPPGYNPDKPWPLILFLHGSGERGSDGLLQTDVGLGAIIRRNGLRPPALIVFPQCRRDKDWGGEMAKMALRCVEETARDYAVDPDRLYLTGLSLGGAGTWGIGAALPDRFAALVPVCGFGNPNEAAKLAAVPTWVFHGGADDRVPVQRARDMVEAIRKAGGNIRYSELPGVGHNSWDDAYKNAELWKWLFAQSLANRGAKPTGG
ncbi:MAG: hypothetical protein CHACPFDD_01033 [Phycisphaerae bacterium]|nr:hypothetical protein [Phycisphaerae bacterium]